MSLQDSVAGQLSSSLIMMFPWLMNLSVVVTGAYSTDSHIVL